MVCVQKHRGRKNGPGVQVCWEVVLKLLVSKRSHLLYKMIPEPAVGSLDYSRSKTRFQETSQEVLALV